MRIERKKNTFLGSVWGIANRVVCTVFPFITRTIIIYKFGESFVGLNSLFSSILQVLNLSELGLTNAIIYNMYEPVAKDNYSQISALLKYYKKLYRLIGVMVICLGVLFLPFITKLIHGEYPEEINIYILFLIYLANTGISYLFFAYKESVLAAYQRNDIINKLKLFFFTLQFVCQCFVLLLLKNYYLYMILMVVFTFLRSMAASKIVDKKYSNIVNAKPGQLVKMDDMKYNMFGITLGKICSVSRGSCDEIIISSLLGLTVLAIYDNYYYILSAIAAIMNVIENSLLSGVGNSIVCENEEKNFLDYNKINFIYMWIGSWCTSCLLCLYQPFMRMWAGDSLMFSVTIMILFCVYFYAGRMSSISNVYLAATGQWWNMKYKSVAEVIANLVLNILFAKCWGVYGILIATILTLFGITFLWGTKILFDNYFMKEKISVYVRQQVIYFGVSVAAAAISYVVCSRIIRENCYVEIALKLMACTIVSNLIYFGAVRKTSLFHDSVKMIYKK